VPRSTASPTNGDPRPTASLTPVRQGLPAKGGTFDALLEMSVDFPSTDRPPFALALVIDRSGSMSGHPLEAAKRAASVAVGMLMPGDSIAVVSYDTTVRVDVPLVGVGQDRSAIVAAIGAITAGATTALHAGWVEGVTQVMAGSDEGAVRRVVLLSDGLANVGVTDAAQIARDVAEAAGHGVGTSALGLGVHYDEALLRAMADSGQGNYVFIEGPDQVQEVFARELAGMGALRGRRLRLTSGSAGVRFAHAASDLRSDGEGVVLPDLTAGLPLSVLLRVTVDAGATNVPFELTWDDVITKARETLSVAVELPSLPETELGRLPAHPGVTLARALLDIAEAKDKVTLAARAHDIEAANERLLVVEGLVAALPAGDERERELEEVARLRRMIDERQFERASRLSEKFSYERKLSRKDLELHDMMMAEAAYRSKRMAAASEAPRHGGQAGHGSGGPGASVAAQPPGSIQGKVIDVRSLDQASGRPVRIEVVLGDITEQQVEAIVNSTNRGLFGTQGVDGAIHRRGGPELTAATRAIGKLGYGEAVFTPGFALPANYVIHTATLPWRGSGDELPTLGRCYIASLTLAQRLGVKTIALPAIGTGTYGYPVD
jgi:Ca-activated chloride channel homolog